MVSNLTSFPVEKNKSHPFYYSNIFDRCEKVLSPYLEFRNIKKTHFNGYIDVFNSDTGFFWYVPIMTPVVGNVYRFLYKKGRRRRFFLRYFWLPWKIGYKKWSSHANKFNFETRLPEKRICPESDNGKLREGGLAVWVVFAIVEFSATRIEFQLKQMRTLPPSARGGWTPLSARYSQFVRI